jgi:hypothetical protein
MDPLGFRKHTGRLGVLFLFLRNSQFNPTFGAAGFQDIAAAHRSHPFPESVGGDALANIGLVSRLHTGVSLAILRSGRYACYLSGFSQTAQG